MLPLKHVLVVLDPERDEQPALDKVLQLARATEFDITLLSVEYTQYLVEGYYFDAVDLPGMRQELCDKRTRTLETLAQPLRDNGLNVETLALWGHPAYETVIRQADRLGADLVVTHTRQHSALSRLLLTHDDWQLVRCCPVPLLLVKEKPWRDEPILLAAVDPKHARHKPSGLDHRILTAAGELASATGGEAWAVHSFSPSPFAGGKVEEARADHQAAFDALMADFDIPAERQVMSEEAPEYALSEVEQKIGADIVLMGAISRSLLSDVFIGNTTEKVLDFLESDVLVLKPEGFASPVLA